MAVLRHFLPAVAGLVLLCACSPSLDWRQARPEGGAISVLLPCKPERRTRQVLLADAPATVEVLSCSAEGTTWGVTSADAGGLDRVMAVREAMRAARAVNLDGRETDAQPVAVQGLPVETPGLRLRVEGRMPQGEPVVERSLLFVDGSRVFHAAALGGTPSDQALETFFDSIERTP